MRSDVYIKDVLARCEALKRAGMWLPEPAIRPRAWIENFDEADRLLAAQLLERFVFYNQQLTDALLTTSFYSIADGLKKGPTAPSRDQLLQALPEAIFTPVSGEKPNPTDSGYFLCRRSRQVLGIPEAKVVNNTTALEAAKNGKSIIFIDDFIGSGDQFLSTWRDPSSGNSFESIQKTNGFNAIYVSLVGTDSGIDTIGEKAPSVAVCVAHKIDERGTFWGLESKNPALYQNLNSLLIKYSTKLRPHEPYMNKGDYLIYGYKRRGLFFSFEHSVPDATLPIFWCRGIDNWEPLIERK